MSRKEIMYFFIITAVLLYYYCSLITHQLPISFSPSTLILAHISFRQCLQDFFFIIVEMSVP